MSKAGSASPRVLDDVELLERLRDASELLSRVRERVGSELAAQRELRRDFPDDLVRAALLLEELRIRGRAKFSRAGEMWFDRLGLEQATSEAVARHKAKRFAERIQPVLDLCCGIGADAIALAEKGEVSAIDLRSAACRMTEWNVQVYGVADRVHTACQDATAVPLEGRWIHVDPDRRPEGRRSLLIEEHQPPLEVLAGMTESARGGAIKLSPASNFGGKFPGCETELISLNGECKEAVVWFGDLRTDTEWRATVLPAGESLVGDPWTARGEQSTPLRYLFDPDPAVVRAGLVDVLCESASLRRLDPAEEYLTADEPVATPFAQPFELLADLPNNDREIRNWFRKSNAGQVEIKCRRIPVSPEKVRQKLPLDGNEALSLIFARVDGRARAIVARRLASA